MAILCVDDNAVNIRVLQQIMRRLGYTDFDVCYDGLEAVEQCRRRAYDLILMDLQVRPLLCLWLLLLTGRDRCQGWTARALCASFAKNIHRRRGLLSSR